MVAVGFTAFVLSGLRISVKLAVTTMRKSYVDTTELNRPVFSICKERFNLKRLSVA